MFSRSIINRQYLVARSILFETIRKNTNRNQVFVFYIRPCRLFKSNLFVYKYGSIFVKVIFFLKPFQKA